VLLGLIFLFPVVVDNSIARESNPINDQLLGTWTVHGSESSPPRQSVRTASDGWVPPDIDTVQPPVANATGCSLPDVVWKTGTRIESFFDNLNRVTAIETIQHQTVSRSGALRSPQIHKINYAALVQRMPGGYLNLEESRGRDLRDSGVSSDDISSAGVFAFAVIFHPSYSHGYLMTCEGLGMWQGQPVWQVRFEERPDNTHHVSVLTVKGKTYYLRVRGRAWILADSYQLARLETDLVQTIPEIRLRFQHEVIEYSLVSLSSTGAVMLPLGAEIYMEFAGHRFYRRHSYTDFQVFSVKVHEEFGKVRE
jgi:hypothetical protein